MSYVNSIELIPYSKREFNHSSDKKIIELEEQSNPYYDFDGLLKLYYKTLKCLNFKLQTQIVEVDEEIYTNGMNLIKK